MSYKIIKNKNYLRKKTEPVSSIEEGRKIADKLLEVLDSLPIGIGLSANQIGISKSVSVVRVKKDRPAIILINPVVTDFGKEKIIFTEGCLSLPGKIAKTLRSTKIMVTALNFVNPMPFGPEKEPITQDTVKEDFSLLETICVQHEIDHLNGILMTDEETRFVPKKEITIKYGRNDKVVVERSGETQYIKYKNAQKLLSEGWKII